MRDLYNQYERAFEAYLGDNHIHYAAVDQSRRTSYLRNRIKSFDFIVYPPCGGDAVFVELKGRKYSRATLTGWKGLSCWTTREDIRGMMEWQTAGADRGKTVRCLMVFAYEIECFDFDPDGMEVCEFEGKRYFFLAVDLDEYVPAMRTRSDGWQTVTLGAEKFRQVARPFRLVDGMDNGQFLPVCCVDYDCADCCATGSYVPLCS